jgi:membrane protein DedA with SNARE-associated domain
VLVLASISESLVNTTAHFVRDGGLPGIFLLMAIGSACIPLPSEVVMLFAGFAVADPGSSHAHHHLTMSGIVLAGLLGTLAGSWSCWNGTAQSCTWDPRRSNARIAGLSATASGSSCSGG